MNPPAWINASPPRPPNDSVGDQTAEALFLAVGRLTHTWEFLEHALSVMFSIISETHSPASMRAFGSVTSPKVKSDMLNAAAPTFERRNGFGGFSKELSRLLTEVGRVAAVRNIAAHGIVMSSNEGTLTGNPNPPESGNFFIVPATYNPRGLESGIYPTRFYASTTINDVTEVIKLYTNELHELPVRYYAAKSGLPAEKIPGNLLITISKAS